MTKSQHQRGLTLIEVLVAFAILAGLTLSVMSLISQNAQYMLSAEERLLATIAADNLLTNDLAVLETPDAGESAGAVEIAGREFAYTRNVIEIGETAILIEYAVRRADGEQTLSRASALKAAAS
ncbi:MAG: type II secretion system minor pseudopilin GspI [Pseudomonadota bacterium]